MNDMTYNQTVKEAIALALVQLMKTTPFDQISVSQITKVAGVGRSSFYRNFDSKSHVLSSYAHDLYKNFFSDKTVMPRMPQGNEVQNFLLPRFKFIKQHKDFFATLRSQNLLYFIFEEMESGLILQLTGQPSTTSKYYRSMFSGACAGIIRKWVDNNFAESEEEMVKIFTNFPQR